MKCSMEYIFFSFRIFNNRDSAILGTEIFTKTEANRPKIKETQRLELLRFFI